jgi:hypothetical protein
MALEFPRCAICRVTIQVGQNVTFRIDGRVQHVECPPVICSVCARSIRPDEPIRRDGQSLVHSNCWVRRYRVEHRVSSLEPRRDVLGIIRLKIDNGMLPQPPRNDNKVWAGQGTGRICDGCDKPIPSSAVECEVDLGDRTLRFHRACLVTWQDGSEPNPISGGSAPGAWTLVFDLQVARRARHERAAYEDLLVATTETCAQSVTICARSAAVRARSFSLRTAAVLTRSARTVATAAGALFVMQGLGR